MWSIIDSGIAYDAMQGFSITFKSSSYNKIYYNNHIEAFEYYN